MNKKIKFIATTLWIVLTRSYDAYCTNQLTPDLSKENNPLVTVLGMTWTPLIATLVVLSLYTLYAFYCSLFRAKDLLPKEKGYSFGQVAAYLYLGYKDNWTAIFYKVPQKLSRFNQYMGHTLTRCLAFAGLVSTLMWLLINYSRDYYKKYHHASIIYGILLLGSILILYRWNKQAYKAYRQQFKV